jgi:HTH-type transcriptional regulator/antitoxin HigA
MSWKYANKDDYVKLVRIFPLVPISSRAQHGEAMDVIKRLAGKRLMTQAENDYFDVLVRLIQDYENKTVKSTPITPQAALKFLIEQNDLTQSDIAVLAGSQKSHISEFLSGKRNLSRNAAAKLGARFKVDPMLFIPKVMPASQSNNVVRLERPRKKSAGQKGKNS